jgi:hypothetical protein
VTSRKHGGQCRAWLAVQRGQCGRGQSAANIEAHDLCTHSNHLDLVSYFFKNNSDRTCVWGDPSASA